MTIELNKGLYGNGTKTVLCVNAFSFACNALVVTFADTTFFTPVNYMCCVVGILFMLSAITFRKG